MGAFVSGGGYKFTFASVGGFWTWTIRANNIQGSGQLYELDDIYSPFGRLYDVHTPIPGDVLTEMANNLSQIQQQLAPMMALVTANASFSITVTEGDSASTLGPVLFYNAGAFGSFLTVTANPDSPWLTAAPSVIVGIGKNQQAQFTIGINPSTLLATSSPYTGNIFLQDNRVPATLIPVPVNVTVLPRPAITTSASLIVLSYNISLGTDGGSQPLQITNSGPSGSILNATVSKILNCSPWLAFVPNQIGNLASGMSNTVTFSVVDQYVPNIPGTYSEQILIASSNASNSPVTVSVSLTVNP